MRKELKTLIVLLLVTLIPFIGFVVLKFQFSHRLSPVSSGFGGVDAIDQIGHLLMGSSHTRAGYDVEIIERETSKSAYALAYSSFNPHLLWPAFRNIVESRGESIDTFIIESFSYSSLQGPRLHDRRVVLDAPPSLKWDYLRLFHEDFQWFEPSDYYELIVSYGNDYLLTYVVSTRLINMLSYHGSYRRKIMTGLSQDAFDALEVPEMFNKTAGMPDPFQMAALHDLIAYSKEKSIDVLFIETPMPGPIERSGLVIRAKGNLRDTFKSKGMDYLDGALDFPLDDPSLFNDDNHLSTKGRELFSNKVATYLKKRSQLTQ